MNARWTAGMLVFAWMTCAIGTAQAQPGPVGGDLRKRLVDAATRDDHEAYVAARAEALELDDEAFGTLLDTLEEAGTWRALFIRDGLETRRREPGIAAEFDTRLDLVRTRPRRRKSGIFMFMSRFLLFHDDLEGTPEFDALRLEAVLTEKAQFPVDAPYHQGEAWVAFRLDIFGVGTSTERNMQKMMAMLRDPPAWIPLDSVAMVIGGLALNPELVDPVVPELLDLYRRFSEGPEGIRGLTVVISRASPEVALPALEAIRDFEREHVMPRDGVEPWATTMEDALEDMARIRRRLSAARLALDDATRQGREDEANQLATEMGNLRDAYEHARLGWTAKAIWDNLNETIERLENARSND